MDMEEITDTSPEKISYFSQAYMDPNGINHQGERLEASGGYTGYVDWNNTNLPLAGDNSARLMVVGEHIDIFVDENARGQGIGEILFSTLLGRVKDKGFSKLVILGVTQKAKKFYEIVLGKSYELKQIENYSVTQREIGGGNKDWLFSIFLG